MPLAFIDFETRSTVDLKSRGTDAYFEGAEATLCAMAVDNGPVRLWEMRTEPEPRWFTDRAEDRHTVFVAHNAQFDRQVFERLLYLHTPTSRWRCTREQAYAHGLPGGLDGLCRALGVPMEHAKLQGGKRLIQLFCTPKKGGEFNEPKDFPDEWEAFKNYALRDVDALRSVHRRLPTHNYTGINQRYAWLNSEINERGFAIDVQLVEHTADLLERAKRRGDTEVSEQTEGAVTAVTQRNKLLAYFRSKGFDIPNLRKAEIERALQRDDISTETRFLLEARLEGARASGAKYKKAVKTQVGGRIRFSMQFSGAGRTGRTAHKGFQPGNMPRAVTYNHFALTLAEQHVPMKAKFIDEVVLPAIRDGSALDAGLIMGGPNTVAANALRHMIVAERGNELTEIDYKNIESRVTSWLAGEDWKLTAYRAADSGVGADLYKLLYQMFFGGTLESINDHQRNAAKVVNLACDFGGSVGAVVTMAVTYGMDLDILPALVLPSASSEMLKKAERVWWRAFLGNEDYDLAPETFMAAHVLVQSYRAANPKIDKFKHDLGRAVSGAVRVRGSFHEVGMLKVWANADLLMVQLPSEYRLCYWAPLIETELALDPETGEYVERDFLSFKRARGDRMIRERTWPGLVVENVAQATANQILRHGSLEVEKEFPGTQVLSVHDSILCEAPVGAMTVECLWKAACRLAPWMRGLPLAADGWQNVRFGKR